MRHLFFLSLILSIFHSSYVFSELYTQTDNIYEVKSIFSGYEEGWVFFQIDGQVPNPNNCTSGDGGNSILGVDPTRSNADQVLSVLLYAQATSQKVGFQIYDSSCVGSHRVIRRVRVVK